MTQKRHYQQGSHHIVIIIALVIGLVGVLGFVGYSALQRKQADAGGNNSVGGTKKQSFRMIQTNLPVRAKDFRGSLKRVMKSDPDVISINEAYAPSRGQNDFELDGYQSWRSTKEQAATENVVLYKASKWKLLSKGSMHISFCGNCTDAKIKKNLNRYANWVILESKDESGLTIAAISTHLLPKPDVHSLRKATMRMSVANLGTLIDELSAEAGAVVMAGDFNYDFQEDQKTKDQGFPLIGLRKKGVQSTFSLLGKPQGGWATSKSTNTYDFIYMTENKYISVDNHKVMGEIVDSDHFPLMADFKISRRNNDPAPILLPKAGRAQPGQTVEGPSGGVSYTAALEANDPTRNDAAEY